MEPNPNFILPERTRQDILKYMFSRPYAEVFQLINLLFGLKSIDKNIGADFISQKDDKKSK
jgi:hypothetical protein